MRQDEFLLRIFYLMNVQSIALSLSQLTPAQQAIARRMVEDDKSRAARFPDEAQPTLTLPIQLNSQLSFQAVFPTLDGPVEMGNASLSELTHTLFRSLFKGIWKAS